MKIAIGNLILCDSPTLHKMSGFEASGQINAQVVEYLEAAGVVVIPRGNARTQISFTISVEFSDLDSAQLFIVTQSGRLGLSGTAVLTLRGFRGGSQNSYMPTATLVGVKGKHIGCSAFVSYTLIGGIISTSAP